MTTHIALKQISKRYGTQIALHELSLDIPSGQLVTIVGPSGCGKTTLLRLLAGFIQPDTGLILFNEEPVHHLPPERRPTVMVFQNYALWPHKTVFEHVAYGLKVAGWNRKAIAHRVQEMLELVELTGLERRYPGQLSGGQQQRVALARALAIAPGVLLLDEPMSSLDAQTKAQMQSDLRRLQQRVGLTTLYVTHDQQEALSMADRVVVMREGQIEQYDAPVAVYQRPATPFVAQFIGQSNLLRGHIQAIENNSQFLIELLPKIPGLATPVVTGLLSNWLAPHPPQVGQVVEMAIKPAQIGLEPTPETLCQLHQLIGQITGVRFLGSHLQVDLMTQWGAIAAHTDSFTLAPEWQISNSEHYVRVHMPAMHLLLF
jgi:ABC-type Fe3+/spermidine/putrescine transport system ATPase subunit